MRLLEIFKTRERATANVAKERLQLIVAHRRSGNEQGPVYLPQMQQDLLEVIRKYVQVSDEAVKVDVERDGELDVLELSIVVPDVRPN